MNILVFDTCFNKSYLVLRQEDKIIASKIIDSTETNYHSAYLIPEIRNILKDNNLLLKDIDVIGVNIGPGSFTGIRAGITIARVMAQQTGIKLVGIESLKVLSKINQSGKNTLVITDARKNKVYLALYNQNNDDIISPKLEDKERITDYINNDLIIITDKSIGSYLQENKINSIIYEDIESDFGLNLSELVQKELKSDKNDFHWAKVKPLYIQKPSITKPKATENV